VKILKLSKFLGGSINQDKNQITRLKDLLTYQTLEVSSLWDNLRVTSF